jgi:hypothetical protein
VRDQVRSLRGLPLHLSGSNVRHLGRATTRVRALLLCRDNIVRFHATCMDRNGGLCTLLRAQWQMEQLLPQTDITPAAGYGQTTDADTAWAVLAGHTLDDIPASSITADLVSGDSDTSVGPPSRGRHQSRQPCLGGRPRPAHTNVDEHEEQQPTTHTYSCCPCALVVVPPHWVRAAVATDPRESCAGRTVHPAHAHPTGSPMRDSTFPMALQLQRPRRPTPQRLRGARSRSQPGG